MTGHEQQRQWELLNRDTPLPDAEVDQRQRELLEMASRVAMSETITNAEKAAEVERITTRALALDRRRESLSEEGRASAWLTRFDEEETT